MSETAQQQLIRLESHKRRQPLLRNNNGAAFDENGRMIRYGLGNDSKKLNETFKSSDLIGITPVTIMPHHVGMTFGLFTAREVKPLGWTFEKTTGDDRARAVAQRNFGEWVVSFGGLFSFATKPEDIWT